MSGLVQDETAEPALRDHVLRRERGQEKKDCLTYTVEAQCAKSDDTQIHVPNRVTVFAFENLKIPLQKESSSIVMWTSTGTAFGIRDMTAFRQEVLTCYFKREYR